VARSCPRDEIRALVEGIDQESGDTVAVLAHIEGCAPCRRFKAKLESKEKAFRSALAAFGSEEPSSRCPEPAEIATVSEKGLDAADPGLVDHIARCGTCRLTLVALAETQPSLEESESASLEETTVAAVKRRVAVARTKSDADAKRPGSSGRVPSGRRARTTRQVALLENRSSRFGLVIAAAACFVVAFVFFAFVHDGSEPQQEANTTPVNPNPVQPPRQQPKAPVKPTQVPAPKPQEAQVPAPAPATNNNPGRQGRPDGDDQVTAMNRPAPVEEEPRETQPEQAPPVQQPAPTKPEPGKTVDQPAPAPSPLPSPVTPQKPGTPPKVDRGELASIKLDAVAGPVEIRKKAEKNWRKLTISDLVQEGDALRARGEDGSVSLGGKARVGFDGDAVGTVAITSQGVRINLESGGIDGESLAYNGLEIADADGVVTAWKGSKLRVECGGEKGTRVAVERGTVNVENDLGKVTVHSGHEISVAKDKKPSRESELRGPYRTPRK
jgi:hypothetical protein